MRQTGGRKDRQLLSSDQGVQTVYRRYTGLDKFGWVITCSRIHRQAVDIQIFFGDQRRAAVLRTTHPVEHAAEHIRRYRQLRAMSEETHCAFLEVDAGGAFKQLYQRV